MGKFLKTKGGFVIDRPGRVLFVPVKADGTLDWVNAIRNTSVINTITVTNSRTTTNIPDGNNFYPAGSRVTDIAGTVAIDFSTVDPAIWGMASGSQIEEKQDDSLIQIYDYVKIEADSTIKLPDKYKTDGYINIIGSDGTEYEKAAGEVSEDNDFKVENDEMGGTKITFNAGAAGKDVAITMEISAKTSSYTQGKKAMKYHKIIISTEYSTLNDTEKMLVNLEISQASLGGDMVDALQKAPDATKTLTFNMYAPLPGEEPYKVKFQDKSEP